MTAGTPGRPSHAAVVTGNDLRSVDFSPSRGFSRGYDVRQVNTFVEECATLVEALEARHEAEIAQLRAENQRPPTDPAVVRSLEVLDAAQRAGEAIVVRAQQVSEEIRTEAIQHRDEARAKAQSLIREATAHCESVLAQTRSETEAMEREAATRSESLVAEAQSQVATMERDARATARKLHLEAQAAKDEIDAQTVYLITLREDIRGQMEAFLSDMLARVADGYAEFDRRTFDAVLDDDQMNRALQDVAAGRSASNGSRSSKTVRRRNRRAVRVAGQSTTTPDDLRLPSPRHGN